MAGVVWPGLDGSGRAGQCAGRNGGERQAYFKKETHESDENRMEGDKSIHWILKRDDKKAPPQR